MQKKLLVALLTFYLSILFFLTLGISSALVLTKTKVGFWIKHSYKFHVICIFLLFLTLTSLGATINGSNRWLKIAGFSFQPGEFIKYSTLLAATKYFFEFDRYTLKQNLKRSLLLLSPLVLLIIQPDFGTFSITLAVIIYACFLSDFPRKLFYGFLFLGLSSFGMLLVAAPYRVQRLLVFLDPWADPHNTGFQIIQSYLAFANGRIIGQGIGNSNEKLFYLPEAYNDFIFSVIGEELGFVGVVLIVLTFLVFIFYGFKIVFSIQNKLYMKLCGSIIFLIGLQAFLNMGVVLGLLPTKGLNLPFISYGGSSMIANLLGIGLIFACVSKKSHQASESDIPPLRSTYKRDQFSSSSPSSSSSNINGDLQDRLRRFREQKAMKQNQASNKGTYFSKDSRIYRG
jgi:cell division protein FtsW